MKKLLLITTLAPLLIFGNPCWSQSIGISGNGAVPDPSSLLDISATGLSPKKGLLIPRMTTTERDAISGPSESLLIYNTDTHCFESYYNGWVSFGCLGCQLPGVFTASAASSAATTSFSANWTASSIATGYYLDVSTVNTFASFVTGYNNLNVSNVLTYSVNTNLACNTTYYYRVRAYNACGTSSNSNTITVSTSSCFTCGTSTVSDYDGNTYNTVSIGTQCWTKENLKTTHYSNGVAMVDGTSAGDITGNYTTKYYFDYANTPANTAIYGKLYTWAAGMNGTASSNSNPSGVQGACPTGWHVPSDAEWNIMEKQLDNTVDTTVSGSWTGTDIGNKLKESGTSHWGTGNGGTNSSNFTALPGGERNQNGTSYYIGSSGSGFWWTSTDNATNPWWRTLYYSYATVDREHNATPPFGFSVRCLKD